VDVAILTDCVEKNATRLVPTLLSRGCVGGDADDGGDAADGDRVGGVTLS